MKSSWRRRRLWRLSSWTLTASALPSSRGTATLPTGCFGCQVWRALVADFMLLPCRFTVGFMGGCFAIRAAHLDMQSAGAVASPADVAKMLVAQTQRIDELKVRRLSVVVSFSAATTV